MMEIITLIDLPLSSLFIYSQQERITVWNQVLLFLSSQDRFPLQAAFELFSVEAICETAFWERQDVHTLKSITELKREWCAGCIHIEMVRSGWHIGPFTRDWVLYILVFYIYTSTWVDFSASHRTSAQVRFKVTLPCCLSVLHQTPTFAGYKT